MHRIAVLAAALLVLALPAAAAADTDHFGRLLPGLTPLNSQTPQQLADLAQTQLDPNADPENNCDAGATLATQCRGSGFTYLGQFLDHDMTLDTSPSPVAPVDPTTLVNSRTFRFDLDSVYGNGPAGSPQLYEADGKHFRIQEPNANGVRDVPRNPDGSAIIAEGRNDENEIIGQIQVAFLKLHNHFVDVGDTFEQARRLTTLYYQRMIVDDFLPHTIGSFSVGPEAMRLAGGMTPVEFSVAAYRFGHSQVRKAYELTDTTGKIQVFSPTAPDLRGGRDIPAGRQIDWGNFFADLAAPITITNGTPDPAAHYNISRKIDQLISSSLFVLPIPGAEAAGSNVLAFRNMIRAKFYDMPSGQTVAQAIHVTSLTDAELAVPETFDPDGLAGPEPPRAVAANFAGGVPLWYYILREASVRENGLRLGPVGTRIVGETFLAVLLRDPNSILRGNLLWRPDPAVAGADGKVQMTDLLVTAGVATRP